MTGEERRNFRKIQNNQPTEVKHSSKTNVGDYRKKITDKRVAYDRVQKQQRKNIREGRSITSESDRLREIKKDIQEIRTEVDVELSETPVINIKIPKTETADEQLVRYQLEKIEKLIAAEKEGTKKQSKVDMDEVLTNLPTIYKPLSTNVETLAEYNRIIRNRFSGNKTVLYNTDKKSKDTTFVTKIETNIGKAKFERLLEITVDYSASNELPITINLKKPEPVYIPKPSTTAAVGAIAQEVDKDKLLQSVDYMAIENKRAVADFSDIIVTLISKRWGDDFNKHKFRKHTKSLHQYLNEINAGGEDHDYGTLTVARDNDDMILTLSTTMSNDIPEPIPDVFTTRGKKSVKKSTS